MDTTMGIIYVNNSNEITKQNSTPVGSKVIIGIILSFVTILTILGNLLVILTVAGQRRLQCVRNYWICALAVTDLLLGILVLPFSTINTTLEWWPLGTIFCNIYVSFDVMLCSISILILFAISLDRHLAVSRPLRYSVIVTKKRMLIVVISIAVFSFLIAFIPIHIGLNTMDGTVQNTKNPQICSLEGNKVYVSLIAIGTYFTPLIIMCVVYMRLFLVTKRQVKQINRLMKSSPDPEHNCGKGKNKMSVSESKATIALSTIILAFTVCWVPYFIIFMVRPFLNHPVDKHLDNFVLWLGYANSTINPILYAFCSTEFRGAFKRMLCYKNCGFFVKQTTEATMV